MKYTLKAILVMALGCLTYSCLDLDPKDQIADGNYWQEASDFKLFANQFYGWTRDFSNSVYDAPHSDKRSDLILDKSGTNVYSNGTNSIPTGDNNYTDNYNRIRRTNILLQKAESYGNQSDIEQYIGEAKFFRAYCYFELLQLYGDVIITKKPLDVTDPEMKVARNDRSEVVDFMIQDLKDAAGQLPLTSAVENGRVGSEGAWAFLSRVALYEGTWQKFRGNEARGKELLDVAAKAAKEVINSKNFSLYTPAILGDSAQKYMFILEDVKSNPAGLLKASNTEYIFSRRHDETLNPIGKNITKECLANAQQIAQKFAALYLCQDGLPIEKSSLYLFKVDGIIAHEYQNRDNRMLYTLCVPGGYYWSNENSRVNWTSDAADKASASIKGYSPANGSGYANQKWAVERKVQTNSEGYDYPVIRYAEVLLNYAEAVYERDDAISDDDLNISLNLVRNRINKSMPKLSNNLVTANGLNMREEIRRERTVELFNEGFRIDDLKRWKTAETEMPKDFLGIKWTGTEYATKWPNVSYAKNSDGYIILETGRKWESKHYLYPLPTDQLQLNPNLKQNPGWGE
ncbi:RagB/SusD family nutrient uptake outer membrane protein [Bacteroides thetaiotaomicron]|uniref:RagB/SusD family nutrient uptake outer membrane protein n=1 Tax=Bacteroides thetaiotaomicron TaxID=818 RepID=UPI0021663271|nr:RagB/SusD family nutrient uptake outer membrane protein [Bacteroides thetaiotaomicron]MCS3219379.1 RagB/SusD family nutrient uptake outer membrane protein [Bacteroides thetaiotaomicron]